MKEIISRIFGRIEELEREVRLLKNHPTKDDLEYFETIKALKGAAENVEIGDFLLQTVVFHVYSCTRCPVTFAVDQNCEDQHEVKCPICHSDEYVKDEGMGEMDITPTKK